MIKQEIASLNWQEVINRTNFLYGMDLQFHPDETSFYAPRLASGKSIKLYRSRTNYQDARRWPELPLLESGKEYVLEADVDVLPKGRYFLQLEFKNRRDETIDLVILRDRESRFTYPEEAFSYTVSIMTAGCYQMVFRSLSLYELVEELSVAPQQSHKALQYETEHLPSELEFVKTLL